MATTMIILRTRIRGFCRVATVFVSYIPFEEGNSRMPRLELAYKGEPAGEYGFSRGSLLTIGRAEDNALILKDTAVS
jgi:hypothetical protein